MHGLLGVVLNDAVSDCDYITPMSMEKWWKDIDGEKPKYSEKKLTHSRSSDHCILKSDLHCRLPLYLVQARYLNCEDAQISTL